MIISEAGRLESNYDERDKTDNNIDDVGDSEMSTHKRHLTPG